MRGTGWVLAIWFVVTLVPVAALVALGLWRTWRARRSDGRGNVPAREQVEILVPVKGVFADQEQILGSLLEQDYPCYRVLLIVEDEKDPAAGVVDRLCRQYPHAAKIVSGISTSCAQKNHNLVQGLRSLKSDTEILVFCDSTNAAPRDWLGKLVNPILAGDAEAVTTFRAFEPAPLTLGGVCQALYASMILLLATVVPKPWGGGTAIRRRTFDRLNVVKAWSRTVVDDLVLGNLLESAGIPVRMDPCRLLRSPLRNQTVRGFLDYLDRQILFPKFTNPGIWAASTALHLNFTVALLTAITLALLFPFGRVGLASGIASYGFLAILVTVGLALKWTNPFPIPAGRWIAGIVPCVVLAAGIFLRSLLLKHIDWHGRRYVTGKGGEVLHTGFKNETTGGKA
jgi:hypothetical protein